MACPKPARLRTSLLKFYDSERRDLPWRQTSDPYAILVSEIMLQQTQVATVIPRWHAFLEEFPTVDALADVPEEKVCEAWAGLGYYRRARNLHKAARQIVEEHEGQFPEEFGAILDLAGVGRYTAGAVASIAFGQEVPVVDGNVIRVLARFFSVARTKDDAALHKAAWRLMEDLVQGERPGDFNQAMMELGATVCTPANPACGRCPIKDGCSASRANSPLQFPMPKVRKKREELFVAFGIVRTDAGYAFVQRPLDGLWAGLWEPLSAAAKTQKAAYSELSETYGFQTKSTLYAEVRHKLTHREVIAHVYFVYDLPKRLSAVHWTSQPRALGLSKLAVKVLDVVEQPQQRHLMFEK